MSHVLNIEPFSEGEKYFMQLLETVNAKNVKVMLNCGLLHQRYNRYTIDDETYNKIRTYLLERDSN